MEFTAPDPSRPGLRFSLRGLPVRIDVSFVAVAVLIGVGVRGTAGFVFGAIVVLLVVIGHEFGHAAAAQAFGLQPRVDLYWLGGLTAADGFDRLSRRRRLLVVVAGPVAGAALGVLAWWLTIGRDGTAGDVGQVALWLGVIWGLANVLPILPLDGGLLLLDLMSGAPERRLRRTRIVSVVVAGSGVIAAVAFGSPILALFPGWFAYVNAVALRAQGSSERLHQALLTALHSVDAASALEAEQMAGDVLAGTATPDVKAAAADLLLAAHLVRLQYPEARAVLAEHTDLSIDGPLRDLAVLGAMAATALTARLLNEPAGHDVRTAAIHYSLTGQWTSLAELAESTLGDQLEMQTLMFCQTRAFYAEAFIESARIGQVAEVRHDALAGVPYNVGCAWARMGRLDDALNALERAAAAGFTDVHQLDGDDDLASLRGLDRLDSIRRRMYLGRRAHGNQTNDVHRRGGAAFGLAGCSFVMAAMVLALPDTAEPNSSISAASQVVAVDLRTGEVRWHVPVHGVFVDVKAAGDNLVAITEARGRSGTKVSVRDPSDGREIVSREGLGVFFVEVRDDLVVVEMLEQDGVVLAAFDRVTGLQRWATDVGGSEVELVGDVAVMSSFDSVGIEAIGLATGEQLWQRDDLIGGGSAGDTVLGATENQHLLVALDASTGTEQWSAEVDGPHRIMERNIWIDEAPHEWTLIDIATGQRHSIRVEDVATEPLVETGDLGVLLRRDGIEAIDLVTGDVRWRQASAQYTEAAAVGQTLIAVSPDGVVARDLISGSINWESKGPGSLRFESTEIVLVESDGVLRALDAANGHVMWTVDTRLRATGVAVLGDTAVFSRR